MLRVSRTTEHGPSLGGRRAVLSRVLVGVRASRSLSLEDIHTWLTRNTTCPLCKIEILTLREFPSGDPSEPIQVTIEEVCSGEVRRQNRRADAEKEPGKHHHSHPPHTSTSLPHSFIFEF